MIERVRIIIDVEANDESALYDKLMDLTYYMRNDKNVIRYREEVIYRDRQGYTVYSKYERPMFSHRAGLWQTSHRFKGFVR